jgi:hypothetical protein
MIDFSARPFFPPLNSRDHIIHALESRRSKVITALDLKNAIEFAHTSGKTPSARRWVPLNT